MKKLTCYAVVILVVLACVVPQVVLAAPTYLSSYLTYDKGYAAIQGFAPVPAKAQVPATVNAAATETVTVTGWVAIRFKATGDVSVYMNTDTTKTMTYEADVLHTIVVSPTVTSFNFVNNGAAAITLEVWGM